MAPCSSAAAAGAGEHRLLATKLQRLSKGLWCRRLVNCEFFWAADESFLVLKCTPFDGSVDNLQLMDMTRYNDAIWNTLYAIDVAGHVMHPISNTPDFSRWEKVLSLGTPQLSPDCRCE